MPSKAKTWSKFSLNVLRRRLIPWRRAFWWQEELVMIREFELSYPLPREWEARRELLHKRLDGYRKRFGKAPGSRIEVSAESEFMDELPLMKTRGRAKLPTPNVDRLTVHATPEAVFRAMRSDLEAQLRLPLSPKRRAEVAERLKNHLAMGITVPTLAVSTRQRMSESQRRRWARTAATRNISKHLMRARALIFQQVDQEKRWGLFNDMLKADSIGHRGFLRQMRELTALRTQLFSKTLTPLPRELQNPVRQASEGDLLDPTTRHPTP